MDFCRLRALIAPALASLFLVLALCPFTVQRPRSMGIRIPMVRVPDQPRNDCSDPNRIVYLRFAYGGSAWINSTEIPSDRLTSTVAMIMEKRSDRTIYVVADPQVSYGEFVSFVDNIPVAKMNLHIALLTDKLRKDFETDRGQAFCELEWPASEFDPKSTKTGHHHTYSF